MNDGDAHAQRGGRAARCGKSNKDSRSASPARYHFFLFVLCFRAALTLPFPLVNSNVPDSGRSARSTSEPNDEGDGSGDEGDGGPVVVQHNQCLGNVHCENCATEIGHWTNAEFIQLPPNSQTCCGDLTGGACVAGLQGDAALLAHFTAPPVGQPNNANRFQAYRHAHFALYPGGAGIRIPHPFCVLWAVRTTFP